VNTNTIKITLEVDDKGSVKIKDFAGDTNKAIKEQTGSLSALRSGWVGLTAGVAAGAAVFYSVSKALSSFIDEAAEAEQIENRLRYALETTGYSWSAAKSAVDEFATSIQETTRFSDEQARQALTDLMMYTQDFAKAQMGAKVAMDMSIRTGQDLGSTSRLIGMAMSGNVEMLGRYIPELRNLDTILGENATMAQKAEYAMKILNEKFGGTARADMNSYSGQLAQMKNSWSDLKETIGGFLIGPAAAVTNWLNDSIKRFQELMGLMKGKEDNDVLIRLRQDLKETENAIELLKGPLEKGVPRGPFGRLETLKPEDQRRVLEQIYLLQQEAEYYKKQIALEEEKNKQTLGAQTKKDVFADAGAGKKQDEIRDATLKAVIEEYARVDEENEKWILLEEARKETARENDLESVRIYLEQNQNLLDEAARTEAAATLQKIADNERLRQEGQEQYLESVRMYLEQEQALRDTAATIEAERTKQKFQDQANQIQRIGQDISNIWTSHLSAMRKGTESFGEGFKNIFLDMADYAISQLTKIMMNQLLFSNAAGTYTSGAGLIGKLGGLFGMAQGGYLPSPFIPIQAFASGGYVNRPTLGMIGEGGEGEYIIPESKMRGQTIIYNDYSTKIGRVDAFDQRSFEERLEPAMERVTARNRRRKGPL